MAITTLARRRNVHLEICNLKGTNQRLVLRRDRGKLNVGRSAGARHDMREGGEAAMSLLPLRRCSPSSKGRAAHSFRFGAR
jgi:hypothetical protein